MKRNKKILLGFLIFVITIPLFWIIDWYWVILIYNLILTYEVIAIYIDNKKNDKVKFKYPLYAQILLCLFLGIPGYCIVLFTAYDFSAIPERTTSETLDEAKKNIEWSDNLWGNELNEDVRRVLRYDEESSVFFKIKTNDGEYIKVIGDRHTLLDVTEEWGKDDEEWYSEADLAGEMDERIDEFLLTKDGFRYTEQDIYRLFEIEGCHDMGFGGYSSVYLSKIEKDDDYEVAYKKWEAYKNKFPLISSKSQFEILK